MPHPDMLSLWRLAAAFFAPAGGGIAGLVVGGVTVGAMSIVPAAVTGHDSEPVASDVAPD